MPIPSLTELTSGQGSPELAFGSGYAGGVPPLNIDFSNTEKRINEIADQAAKQKQADKAAFEKTLTSKLQSIGKYDGILPEDRQELQSLNNQVRSEIIKNSYLYAPGALSSDANKNKLAELEDKIAEYSAKVDKSKQDKKFEEQLNVTLRTRPEYNNEETEALLQEWRSKKVDERTPFMPIDSGDKELLAQEKEFYKNPSKKEVKTMDVEGDPMAYNQVELGYFDKDAYRNIFKNAKGQYYASKYRRSPELQAQWEGENGGYEGYINSVADTYVKGVDEPLPISQVKRYRDEAQIEEGRNTRQQNAIEAGVWRTNTTQENINSRQEKTLDAKDLNSPEQRVANYQSNIIQSLNDASATQKFNLSNPVWLEYYGKTANKYNAAFRMGKDPIAQYNVSKLYPGGESSYGDAYGELFVIEDKKKNKLYAPAKELHIGIVKGEQTEFASKKALDDSFAEQKQTLIVPDLSKVFNEVDFVNMLLPESLKTEQLSKNPAQKKTKRTKSTPMFDANGNRIK